MADRYWVGGSGTWDATSTTNWATSSGGASGASAPTASDNVFFDSNSNVGTGAFTVTVSAAVCNDITIGGASAPQALDGAMTLAFASSTLTVSGSWTNQATNFAVTNTAATVTFNATTTGKTITTNGVTIGVTITLNGVGGAWTLGSALNISIYTLTLTNGTFDTSASNYAVTASAFSSSNSNIRTINLNGSTVTLGAVSTAWQMTTSTNATLNAGTSTINLTSSNLIFAGGGLTYYNVQFTSTSAGALFQVLGASTYNNFTVATASATGLSRLIFTASQTINGTLTANGSNGNIRLFVNSQTIGTTATLTCAAIAAMTDVDFRDITIAGAHGTLSGTRLGDCGGNSNITFVAGANKYWNLAAGGNWSATAWALGSGGSVADTNFPLPQDTVIIENTGLNTSATVTINAGYNIGTLDTSTRTNAMTLASSGNAPTFYGNFTYGSGVTPTGTGTYTFSNRSTKTLNSGGKTFTQPITITAPSGGIQLVTNNLTLGTTLTTTLAQGTLDLNNLTLSTGLFSSNTSNTRTIAFGSTGSIVTTTTTAGSTVLSMATATNFTFTGTSNISAAMSTTRTFNFGGAGATTSNRLNINLTSGASVPTFTGSFRQVNFTGSTCNTGSQTINCHGFTLASGGTYTTTTFTTVGTGTLTSNGKSISTLRVNASGITTTLSDALICTSIWYLTQGTIDLNGFSLTTPGYWGDSTFAKNITFNGGTIFITIANPFAWDNVSGSGNLTTTAGTGTGTISMTAATAKAFQGGGATYNCTLNQGGAGDLTITGSNTFDNITNTVQPASVLFTAGTTSTFLSGFSLSGTAGNLITIGSATAASHTLSKASGTVSVSYCSISRSSATGGATYLAFTGNGNVDGGNNTGWLFSGTSVASRITSTGVLSIAGELDEVTQTTIRLTSSNLYSSEFDEYTLQGAGGGLAKRETSTGKIQVTGQFDEYNKPYA